MREFYLIPVPADVPGPDDPDTVIAVNHFPCVLGRQHGCDRVLDHPKVSRQHCAFGVRDGRAWVKDLGSSNGTFLNGKPLRKARPLADGDRLDIAGLPFLCLSSYSYQEAVGEESKVFHLAGS